MRRTCTPPAIGHGLVPATDRRARGPPLSVCLSLPRGLYPAPPLLPLPHVTPIKDIANAARPFSFSPPSLPPSQARHEHHLAPPLPPVPPPPSTARFGELSPPTIVALRRRPPLIPCLLQLQDASTPSPTTRAPPPPWNAATSGRFLRSAAADRLQ
jgi:hypothetical protein